MPWLEGADDQTLARGVDHRGRNRVQVVDGQYAFDLSEQALDEPKVAAGHARDRVDDIGLHGHLRCGIQSQLDPLAIDDVLELASAQRLELVHEANP